jgi:hypothetical protein
MDGSERALAPVARWAGLTALLLALPAVLLPLGLRAEADAVDYRVPMLQWMLRHRTLPSWPWTPIDNYPMLGELLMLPLRACGRCMPDWTAACRWRPMPESGGVPARFFAGSCPGSAGLASGRRSP